MNDALHRSRTWLTYGLFICIYAALHASYQHLREGPWAIVLIDTLTVAPAASLSSWVVGDADLQALGAQLVWPLGRLTLRVGCDGFEMMAILAAAILVAPINWRRGLAALAAGLLLIWGANQLRIVLLYWSFRHQREWFDALHVFWLPLVLVAITGAYFKLVVLAGPSERSARAAQ